MELIEPELLESLYWGNGYTLQHIASIFGCHDETIRRRMIGYDIPCRSVGNIVTDFTFNDRQKEIFEGCMLGDGGLTWMTNYCRFHNTDSHKDYLVWLQKQLGVEHISNVKPVYEDGYAYYYGLVTRVIPSIQDDHRRWYPYESRWGTIQNMQPKIIPKDIEITPIKMLFWYIGDGQYVKRDGTAVFWSCLIFEDWLLLSKKVRKVLNVDGGISINKNHKDKDGVQKYYLRLNKAVTIKFFDMVDSLGFDIPKCYLYKFVR